MKKIKNLNDLIESFKNEKKIALIYNNKKISYDNLYNDIIAFSSNIFPKTLGRRLIVGIILNDNYEDIVSLFATIHSGSIPLLISDKNFFQKKNNLKIISKINKFIITENLVNKKFSKKKIIKFSNILNSNYSNLNIKNKIKFYTSDTAIILLTSGTTGLSKGVMLSHKNLLTTSLNLNKFMKLKKNIKEYLMAPLSNSFGFMRLRSIFLKKGCLVVDSSFFNPLLMLRRVQEHSINSISGVPSSFQMLLSLPLSSLRKIRKDLIWMEIGSAAMDKNFKLRLLKLFSKQIIAYHYGLTEASRSTVIDLKKDLNKIETVGKPFFGVKINICDKKKEIIKKINTIGEIVIEGSNVAKGYFNAHPKNFKKNRFYTGDLGSIDQNGYLTIHGRVDDLMNVGGVKISPTLIEKIINDKFPLNCEFVVYNSILKDKILGQRMALFVNKFIKKKNLITKINDTLLSNGIPSEGKIKDLFFINKFPKTINGKIKRQEISKNILTKINIHDHI